ncbi:Ku protein [Streptomyces sp. NPDC086081]|uniref:Ku protein n=1 Tax=Streptomyces sp. NPDC086081 TaxID=3365749 RepID=UPI0037FDA028
MLLTDGIRKISVFGVSHQFTKLDEALALRQMPIDANEVRPLRAPEHLPPDYLRDATVIGVHRFSKRGHRLLNAAVQFSKSAIAGYFPIKPRGEHYPSSHRRAIPLGLLVRTWDDPDTPAATSGTHYGYYLEPSGQVAHKPYKLLAQALGRSAKVAVAKYAWSGRERLSLLRVRDDVIVLHAMRWPDEIRDPSELPPPVQLSDEEIEGALALMDSMTREDLEGAEFKETYTEALEQFIEAKREHREPPALPETEGEPGQIVDLMAVLTQSVQKARAGRGEDADVQICHRRRPRRSNLIRAQTAQSA